MVWSIYLALLSQGNNTFKFTFDILIYTLVNVFRVLLKRVKLLFVSLRNIYYLCFMDKNILLQQINSGASTWKLAELNNTTQTNIRYWLNKYDLKTNRKANDLTNHKICPNCKITKLKTEFYISDKKGSSYCKSCILVSNTSRRIQVKQQAVDYLGGACSKCGYNKCLSALEFHHVNSSEKDKNYVNSRLSFEKLKPELDKCVLLCANCHREHHSSTKDI